MNVKRVRRLMRLHGMANRCVRRRCRTTFLGADGYTIPDLVGRAFTPGAHVAWCYHISYIATGEGWLQLASVLDLGRRLRGYSMADHMRTELVAVAVEPRWQHAPVSDPGCGLRPRRKPARCL